MDNFDRWVKEYFLQVDCKKDLENVLMDSKPKWLANYISDAYDAGFEDGKQKCCKGE